MHRSSERFAHHYPFGPPPSFRRASPYPRIDRLASGIPPMTFASTRRPSPHKEVAGIRFPCGYVVEPLNLAIDQNSLARYSKRTIRRRSTARAASLLARRISLLLSGFRLFSSSAKSTFQLSLTLLLRYRSRGVFRVGSLCLPNSRAISNARYSRSSAVPRIHHYGAITLYCASFQRTSC